MNYDKLSTDELIRRYKKNKIQQNKRRDKRNRVKVEYKSLGTDSKKRKICGWAYINDNRIEIEKKSNAKEIICYIVHECAHLAAPDLTEPEILRLERVIALTLWEEGYRKVILK